MKKLLFILLISVAISCNNESVDRTGADGSEIVRDTLRKPPADTLIIVDTFHQ